MQFYFNKNREAVHLTTPEEARTENAAIYKALNEERLAIDSGHNERVDTWSRKIGPAYGKFSGSIPSRLDRVLDGLDIRGR